MMTAIARFCRRLAASALVVSSVALAQEKPANYPTRPIRLIVTVSPGAGGDTIARAAGQILSDHFGQTVVVDNRAGGSGVIATELVANAPADGHTILSYADALLMLGVTKRVPFDVLRSSSPSSR